MPQIVNNSESLFLYNRNIYARDNNKKANEKRRQGKEMFPQLFQDMTQYFFL